MAVDERTRHALHARAIEVLGADHAETLMSMLPPVGWADVATRRDLDVAQAATKQDIELLRRAVRHDMGLLRSDVKHDLAELKTELKGDIHEIRVELHRTLGSHTRTLFLGLTGVMFTVATLTWAAVSLT